MSPDAFSPEIISPGLFAPEVFSAVAVSLLEVCVAAPAAVRAVLSVNGTCPRPPGLRYTVVSPRYPFPLLVFAEVRPGVPSPGCCCCVRLCQLPPEKVPSTRCPRGDPFFPACPRPPCGDELIVVLEVVVLAHKKLVEVFLLLGYL